MPTDAKQPTGEPESSAQDAEKKSEAEKQLATSLQLAEQAAVAAAGRTDPLVGEIVETVRETVAINVNVIVQNITSKATGPEQAVEATKALLGVVSEYEQGQIEKFRQLSAAVIQARTNDPDLKDRRQTNGVRRGLIAMVAICLPGSVLAALFCAIADRSTASILVCCSLAVFFGMLTAVLGSGGNLTTDDVVKMVRATAAFASSAVVGNDETDQPPQHVAGGSQRKRKK